MTTAEETTMQLPGVPESIEREQVNGFLASLGIDVNDLRSLALHLNAIEAEVYAVNADGRRYADEHGDIAIHKISIPLVPQY